MNKKNIRVRKGQAPEKLSRDDFRARFFDKFTDPAFGAEASVLKRIESSRGTAIHSIAKHR